MELAVTALAVGTRNLAAVLAVLGSAAFAVLALTQAMKFLTLGAPVAPAWAGLAAGGALAGFPMAALSYLAAILALSPPSSETGWEKVAAGFLAAGIAGFGLCGFACGVSLAAAVALNGQSTVHVAGAGLVLPVAVILMGVGVVIAVNIWRGQNAWTMLGHVLWGALGVTALTVGVPMLIDAGMIDDAKTLSHRFNLFIVFYPLIWTAYAGAALAIVYGGFRALRFGVGFAAEARYTELKPQSTALARPVEHDATLDITNKAA
jgi:hypothetical protein